MNKQNRYLFIYTFISFLISFLIFVGLIANSSDVHWENFLEFFQVLSFFFAPFFLVFLFSTIGFFTDKKFHKATVIIVGILNIFVIIFIQILYPILAFLLLMRSFLYD